MRKVYQVCLGSVLDCQMDEFDFEVRFDSFSEAKGYALEALEFVINRLTYLNEQIKEANQFEDLDLGWWEPLFEEIDVSDPQPSNQ